MRRPALLLGAGAVLVVLALLVVVLVTRDGDDPAPAPTAPATSPPPEALTTVLSSTFDEGDEGWTPLGEGVAVRGAEDVTRDGAGSLLVTGRTEPWHGAAVDLSGAVARGQAHTVSAWVRLGEDAQDADVQLTLERDPGSDDPLYVHVARGTATAGDWVELSGTAQVPEGDGEWRLYVETTGSTADLRLDDVTVRRPTPAVQTDLTGLKDAADVPLGAAVGPQDLSGRPAELLLRHFDQVTPENAMKPVTVQPTEGTFDFGPMDEVLDFAAAHGLTVHGHTLVWHRSTPDWFFEAPDGRPLTDSDADRALLLDRLRTHTRAIADHLAERYGDASPVTSWDVVNEALDPEQPDGLRHSRWYDVLGPGYVADAFRIAREELGPDVTLFLNDYDTDAPDRRRGLVDLVMGLQAAGAPVDAVGHQMHVGLDTDVDRVATTLDAVAALGVRQAVTELDVAISGVDEQLDGTPPDRLEEQRTQVEALVSAFAARDLTSITVWGLYDTRSWLRAWPQERPYEAPLLFDDELQAKPAYEGFLAGLGQG